MFKSAVLGTMAPLAAAVLLSTFCSRAHAGAVLPDLVIAEVLPSDPVPAVDDTITVSVTVLNQGTADAVGPFKVELYLRPGVRPDATMVGDMELTCSDTLAPDESTVLVFIGITSSVVDSWRSYAYVDRLDDVAEKLEVNNITGPASITWGGGVLAPNLKISAITPSTPTPTPGTPIDITVTVENNGKADAVDFRLDLFTNLPAPPDIGDTASDPTPMTGLSVAMGASQDFVFSNVVSATPATWEMYAIVDTVEAVNEVNENDNIFGPATLIWGSAASLRVDSPNGGETFDVGSVQSITWTSIGDTGENVLIEYSTDGGASVWHDVIASTLNDGSFDWTVPDDASTDCIVRISSTTLSYSDESDAVFTIQTPTVLKPDLKILSIVPSDPNPTVSTSISVTVIVINQGDEESGLFTVDLFTNRGSEPSIGDSEGLTKSVTNLLPEDSTSVVFTGITSDIAEIWNTYAIVDTGQAVDESNESNNVAGPVQIGWGGGVSSITVTSPNGTEVLSAYQQCVISWAVAGSPGPPYHIEYSTDGGTSWDEVVNITYNADSYTWIVPPVASTECRVLVSNITGTISDVSDVEFEIQDTARPWLGGGCGGAPCGRRTTPDAVSYLLPWLLFLAAAAALRSTKRSHRPSD
ncbi:MAG: hypothetical protein JW909_02150 [Planctomycetes bacterium]|nr:hypothetical protein [Planctomycetota bacterium]